MHREKEIEKLKRGPFDVLVMGGGATGCGVALDAASRGLSVALVEREDFAAGTSSRSTKLIHGGVRYLENAVLKFDSSQFRLVREALHERSTLLRIAPHLSHWIPLLVPMYKRFESSYYLAGLKLYDRLAGKALAHKSRFASRTEALRLCPQLKEDGLRGGVIYYDGQFDDARMNVAIAMTAVEQGACVANYVEVKELLKQQKRVAGAKVRDVLTGEEWEVRAKSVINATGPFSDEIRRLEDSNCRPVLQVSSGVHIVLNKKFAPQDMGLVVPKTEDNRILFLLPWLDHTLIGTTDNPAKVTRDPKATEEDVLYILRQLERHFDLPIDPKKDILSVWCGLRPLVSAPENEETASLSRDHLIEVSKGKLITITGGKWTTYRLMAQDTVDTAIQEMNLKPKEDCQTTKIKLYGGEKFSPDDAMKLMENYDFPAEIAEHLNQSYGDRAKDVAEIAKKGYEKRLAPEHPYLEAEVVYGAKEEGARSSVDILARRTRLAFLDRAAASRAAPRVQQILAQVLNWSEEDKARDATKTKAHLSQIR